MWQTAVGCAAVRRSSDTGCRVRSDQSKLNNTGAVVPRRRRPQISPQVVMLRRRVWTIRFAFVLAIVLLTSAYTLAMNQRGAHLREPATALGPDGQVMVDARTGLTSHVTQIAMHASMSTYAGKLIGPVAPTSLVVQSQTGRWVARISGYGTFSEYGYPVLTAPTIQVADHTLDRSGLVSEITLECVYLMCWDRGATAGRILSSGDPLPLPDVDDKVSPGLLRYSDGYRVVDRVTLQLNNRSLRWEIQTVERLARESAR